MNVDSLTYRHLLVLNKLPLNKIWLFFLKKSSYSPPPFFDGIHSMNKVPQKNLYWRKRYHGSRIGCLHFFHTFEKE